MFNQYILILVWIGFMTLLQENYYQEEYSKLTGGYERRATPLFAFVAFFPVILMAGFRNRWFADTGLYVANYLDMPNRLSGIPSYLSLVSKDKGFSVLSVVIKSVLGDNFRWYLMLFAFLQGAVLIFFFRKYSTQYILSIFLFVASTDYISWMFNGIRQFSAVTIILLATELMLKRKYIPLIIVILIASTFHQSALLMIPFVIISQGEAWNKKTIFFIMGVLLAVLFVGQFTNILDDALSTTQYTNVVSDYMSAEDDGTNPLRVLVYSIPAIIAFIGRDTIKQSNNALINFCANMSIISMGLYIVSMVTSGVYIGRLPIYCSLYGYILLSWEVKHVFSESNKKTIKISLVFGYLAFYYYQMHIMYGVF